MFLSSGPADLVGFDADVWVDFTMPAVAYENTRFALEEWFCTVVGTTGFTESLRVQELTDLSKDKSIGGLIAPNFFCWWCYPSYKVCSNK